MYHLEYLDDSIDSVQSDGSGRIFQIEARKRGTHAPHLMPDSDNKPELLHLNRQADYYDMRHEMHGVAVIVNNTTFDKHLIREWSDIDEHNLKETFLYLGYRVIICRNLKSYDIVGFFENIDKILEDSNAGATNKVANDSFVCCMLSHGSEGVIAGSDSEPVNIQSIELSLEQSKMLKSKPKMLFIQACRGDNPGRVFVVILTSLPVTPLRRETGLIKRRT